MDIIGQINRIQPAMPVAAYQTYSITSPHDVLVATACEQAGCLNWRHGWETKVDESSDLGRQQAEYIRTKSRRTFTERRTGDGLTVFRFEAGQRCFADHKTRPEVYVRRHGDWRGNPSGKLYRHTRPIDWVEDFSEHQDKLKTELEKG